MPEITTVDVKDLLVGFQGQEITLDKIRHELEVERGTKAFEAVRNIVFQLAEAGVVRYISRSNYKVVRPAKPVQVFGVQRERRPLFPLIFPKDHNTEMELDFAEHIVVREGDLIVIGGVKSTGKTTLMLAFCGENIDKRPVLMGHEYTILGENGEYEPAPRFVSRMDKMAGWVQWTDDNGMDKFELLPVWEDYVESMHKNRFTLIDWINPEADRAYDIGKILGGLKAKSGRGVTIAALQKSELGNDGRGTHARGGQYVRDYADVEILLDGYGESEYDVMLTIKGVKEKTAPIVGKRYAYSIANGGTQIVNFRGIKQCPDCYGRKFVKGMPCETCNKIGWVDK